ncbi:MAG: sensor histidine kinase [Sphingobacteriia bacterium]|nr:sensor histidine kinase [Sphingobacteriia bacterium]
MRKIQGLLLLYLFTGINIANGQYQQEIDSLKKKLQPTIIDTSQINLLTQLAFYYSFTDSVQTFRLSQQATGLSNSLRYKPGIANASRAISNYYIVKRAPQKALPLLQQEMAYWLQLKRPEEMAAVYTALGQCFLLANRFEESAGYFKKSEELLIKLRNTRALGTLYHNAGSLYTEKGDNDLAIEYLIKSLAIQETTGDTKMIGATQSNIGRLLYQTKNYPKAIEYFLLSIQSNTRARDWRNLGIAHINLANVYAEQLNYPRALQELDKGLQRFKQVDFKRGIQLCSNNLGAINLRQGHYDTSIYYFKQGLQIARENQNQSGVALIEQNIGFAYTNLKNYHEALKWFNQAELTAAKYGADQFTYGEIYNHRATLDSMMGNYSSALAYRTRVMSMNEKSLNDKVIRQVNELQTRYETERKEFRINLLSKSDSIKSLAIANQQLAINQNKYRIAQQELELADAELKIISDSLLLSEQKEKLLRNQLENNIKEEQINSLNKLNRIRELEVAQKNNLIALVSISTIALLALGYLLYRRNKQQQEKIHHRKILQQQQQAAIDIITAEEEERKRIASDLHDGVGQLMSAAWLNLKAVSDQMMSNARPEDVQLIGKTLALVNESCKEVRQVSHNMMPNALLMKGLINAVREFIGQIDQRSIQINLQTDGLNIAIPSHIESVLYRVIQESVNNVIKHAQASELDISIHQEEDAIDVMIEDNGRGFDKTKRAADAGIGLQNIQSRIDYLRGTVEWNTAPGKGTVVAIYIPLNNTAGNQSNKQV